VRLLLDVPNELVTLGLELIDPVLDDVADADDRLQAAVHDDRVSRFTNPLVGPS